MGSEGLNVCRIVAELKIAKYFKPLPRLSLLLSAIVIYSIFITTVQANESLFGRLERLLCGLFNPLPSRVGAELFLSHGPLLGVRVIFRESSL